MATEQKPILKEAFFEYQRTDSQFPERYPLQTDISVIGLGGCLRIYDACELLFLLFLFFLFDCFRNILKLRQ